MFSIAVILLVLFFGGLLVGGLVWAVREDYKESNKNKK